MIEAAAPAIEIDRLRTDYDGTAVLEDITLTVVRDEIFGLLGSNGAGKTSLVKSILMLIAPQAGTVRLFGEPHHLASVRSRIGYLPERFQPPSDLSGHDFVRLTLAFYGRRAQRVQTAALAEQLELRSQGYGSRTSWGRSVPNAAGRCRALRHGQVRIAPLSWPPRATPDRVPATPAGSSSV